MKNAIEERLEKIGVVLPDAPPPQGSYAPWIMTGNLVFLAGQIPLVNGKLEYKGIVPNEVTLDEAKEAAKICAINLMAQLRSACNGELDRVTGIVKVGGFVACEKFFTEHPKVINGASDLISKIFGHSGAHTRAAVSTNSLPLGVAVEVDAIFELN